MLSGEALGNMRPTGFQNVLGREREKARSLQSLPYDKGEGMVIKR